MPQTRPPEHTIEIAGGRVHVHLSCTKCSDTAWTHQHIAWLAECLTQCLMSNAGAAEVAGSAGRRISNDPIAQAPIRQGSLPITSVSPLQSVGPDSVESLDIDLPLVAGVSTVDSSPFVDSKALPTSSTTPTQTVSLGKKGPRTRTGCFTCRMKRVKCDEAKLRSLAKPPKGIPGPLEDSARQPTATNAIGPTNGSFHTAPSRYPVRQRPYIAPNVLNMAMPGLTINAPEPMLTEHHGVQEQFALFLDGVQFVSAPNLLNARPTTQGARARSDRVLAKLWEAQMFISGAGVESNRLEPPNGLQPIVTQQTAMAKALVAAARSLGIVRRAIAAPAKSPLQRELMLRSREYARDAAKVIHTFNSGDGANDPETILILFGLFLLRDCAVADPAWSNTHTLLRTYIQRNGGVKAMLDNDKAARLGNSLLEHHMVYVTIYDTFAALTLNLEPYLLSMTSNEWMDEVTCAQQVCHADFGLSLQILFCVAKVATLLALKPNDPTSPQSPSAAEYPSACQKMYEELETVTLANIYSTPAPTRVQFGDLLIRHALVCHLQGVAFGRHRSDPIIQRSASAIMELLAEVAIRTGSMVNLCYPMVMAAALINKEDQHRLQVIIDFAKVSSSLVELDQVESIAHECWRRSDAGEELMKLSDIWCSHAPILLL